MLLTSKFMNEKFVCVQPKWNINCFEKKDLCLPEVSIWECGSSWVQPEALFPMMLCIVYSFSGLSFSIFFFFNVHYDNFTPCEHACVCTGVCVCRFFPWTSWVNDQRCRSKASCFSLLHVFLGTLLPSPVRKSSLNADGFSILTLPPSLSRARGLNAHW